MTDRTLPADLSRRVMIRCAALCGVAAPVLAACGSGDDATDAADPDPSASASTPRGTAGGLVAAADVPVGGGVVLADAQMVVTRPARGRFRGFSSVCTHRGSMLTSVENGVITCPNHGSQFAIEDGANVTGPSGEPAGSVPDLPAVAVRVRRGQVVRA